MQELSVKDTPRKGWSWTVTVRLLAWVFESWYIKVEWCDIGRLSQLQIDKVWCILHTIAMGLWWPLLEGQCTTLPEVCAQGFLYSVSLC